MITSFCGVVAIPACFTVSMEAESPIDAIEEPFCMDVCEAGVLGVLPMKATCMVLLSVSTMATTAAALNRGRRR